MKLYQTIRREEQVLKTHSKNGTKLKKPKKETEYWHETIPHEKAFEFISDRLSAAHLEESLSLVSKFVAAMALDDKEKMARLLEVNYSEQHMDDDYNFHKIVGYEFKD